ncbi:MAG: CAP domain-containing protein [Solirubrobacterales bacterium]
MQGTRLTLALAAALLALAAAPAEAPAARGLLAPAQACPGQSRAGAAVDRQLRAMRCLTNFARRQRGLPPLRRVRALDRAAGRKSADILRCDEFSHEACGREFTYWVQRFGYLRRCSRVGENIAWGTGRLGTPRSLFSAWLRSPGHRANILRREYEELGLGLRTGRLEGNGGARVWTQEFGGDC